MGHSPPLTGLELEVLQRIARGHSNHRIARDTWRSIETIRTHCKNIYRKLGAHNRTHAVAIAYHVGLFRGSHAHGSEGGTVTPLGTDTTRRRL